MSEAEPWHSLCVDCGPNVAQLPSSSSATCGTAALGSWLEQRLREWRDGKRPEGTVERVLRGSLDALAEVHMGCKAGLSSSVYTAKDGKVVAVAAIATGSEAPRLFTWLNREHGR
jgi:hypothetical protein